MTLTATALLLLNAQRHELEGHPQQRELSLRWLQRVQVAQEHGDLVVFVQWDGPPDTPGETFGSGWTLHPDLRAAGSTLLRARRPDAFAGSDLGPMLHDRAVRDVFLLGFPGTPELEATAASAQRAGFGVILLAEVGA